MLLSDAARREPFRHDRARHGSMLSPMVYSRCRSTARGGEDGGRDAGVLEDGGGRVLSSAGTGTWLKGLAAMKYRPGFWSARTSTLVV